MRNRQNGLFYLLLAAARRQGEQEQTTTDCRGVFHGLCSSFGAAVSGAGGWLTA